MRRSFYVLLCVCRCARCRTACCQTWWRTLCGCWSRPTLQASATPPCFSPFPSPSEPCCSSLTARTACAGSSTWSELNSLSILTWIFCHLCSLETFTCWWVSFSSCRSALWRSWTQRTRCPWWAMTRCSPAGRQPNTPAWPCAGNVSNVYESHHHHNKRSALFM